MAEMNQQSESRRDEALGQSPITTLGGEGGAGVSQQTAITGEGAERGGSQKACACAQCVGPLVSIIIPVYNTAPFLPELFDSLFKQTHANLEIICVNDGSKDDSLEVLRRYASEDARINVVDKENSGAGKTRNLGLQHVHGEYTCFVDSDDFIEPNTIELLVSTATKTQADVVVFGMDQYDDQTGEFTSNIWVAAEGHIPEGEIFCAADVPNFYKHLIGFTVNKFYRSSFLLGLELTFPDVGAHEDMPFTYLALSAAEKTYYLNEPLYHYRRSRVGSLSDGTNKQYRFMFDALQCLEDGLKERGLWERYERDFVNYVLHMCVWKHSMLGKFRRLEFRSTCKNEIFPRMGIWNYDERFLFDEDERTYYRATIDMPLSRRAIGALYRVKLNMIG